MVTDELINNCIQNGYRISTDKQLLDVDSVYYLLANESYWAKGMPHDIFKRAVENSMCFGIYKDNTTVGFARVITDHATFAYICDVFIRAEHRGHSLGKWLIHIIKNHPELQGLRRWSLATRDAHGLYTQFGFVPLADPNNWMEIKTPYTNTRRE
jgi:GNAT superfamily N-acetyltransferase